MNDNWGCWVLLCFFPESRTTCRMYRLKRAWKGHNEMVFFSWPLMKQNPLCLSMLIIIVWLVVDLPLWNIWVRQLGLWHSQYMESHNPATFQSPPTSHSFISVNRWWIKIQRPKNQSVSRAKTSQGDDANFHHFGKQQSAPITNRSDQNLLPFAIQTCCQVLSVLCLMCIAGVIYSLTTDVIHTRHQWISCGIYMLKVLIFPNRAVGNHNFHL